MDSRWLGKLRSPSKSPSAKGTLGPSNRRSGDFTSPERARNRHYADRFTPTRAAAQSDIHLLLARPSSSNESLNDSGSLMFGSDNSLNSSTSIDGSGSFVETRESNFGDAYDTLLRRELLESSDGSVWRYRTDKGNNTNTNSNSSSSSNDLFRVPSIVPVENNESDQQQLSSTPNENRFPPLISANTINSSSEKFNNYSPFASSRRLFANDTQPTPSPTNYSTLFSSNWINNNNSNSNNNNNSSSSSNSASNETLVISTDGRSSIGLTNMIAIDQSTEISDEFPRTPPTISPPISPPPTLLISVDKSFDANDIDTNMEPANNNTAGTTDLNTSLDPTSVLRSVIADDDSDFDDVNSSSSRLYQSPNRRLSSSGGGGGLSHQSDSVLTTVLTHSPSRRRLSGSFTAANGGVVPASVMASPQQRRIPPASPISPARKRLISPNPIKVLDAPCLNDDFYLNLIDWGASNIVAVGLSDSVYLWNATNSKVTRLCSFEAETLVTSVSWIHTGTHVAIGTSKGLVHLWDVDKQKEIRQLKGHSARVGALAWNHALLTTGSRDHTILQRDVRSPQHFMTRLSAHRQEVCGLKWSPDGRELASGGNDNTLHVWTGAHQSAPLHRFTEHTAAVKAIAWSPHQTGLLASGGGTADRCIRFWNTVTGTCVQHVDTDSQVCNLAWSQTSNELVSTHGYSENRITIWKYPSMSVVSNLMGHTSRVLYLSVSPDSQTIVTGAGDETLRFWNVFPPNSLRRTSESSGSSILQSEYNSDIR